MPTNKREKKTKKKHYNMNKQNSISTRYTFSFWFSQIHVPYIKEKKNLLHAQYITGMAPFLSSPSQKKNTLNPVAKDMINCNPKQKERNSLTDTFVELIEYICS